MGLPWVRLDAGIASHDKTLTALSHRGGKGAMAVYCFALAWAGGQATDGHVPRAALAMLHGTAADAAVLEDAGLWEPDPEGNGWWIHNYGQRQETSAATEARRQQARDAANARWKAKRLRGIEGGKS